MCNNYKGLKSVKLKFKYSFPAEIWLNFEKTCSKMFWEDALAIISGHIDDALAINQRCINNSLFS